MVYDVVVVGAGPAGLSAAVSASRSGAAVLLMERMSSPGRKLLVSGSGQCNLTHEGAPADFLGRYGDAGKFLRAALYAFPPEALKRFCAEGGLALETAEGGKVFPASRRARDVLDLFVEELRRAGGRIRTDARVLSARKDEDGLFEVEVEGSRRTEVSGGLDGGSATARELCRSLILCCGGKSYPKTGSSGDGYALARLFGHRIAEVAPALTPITARLDGPSDFAPFADCAGISVPGTLVSVFRDGRKVAEGRGDVLITHRGLSGPGILDLSRRIRGGDELRVSLSPGRGGIEEVESSLRTQLEAHGTRGAARLLRDFGLPDSLACALLASCGAPADLKAAVLPRTLRRRLALSLAEGGEGGHPFIVESLGSWDEAMATRGGVELSEVDPKRLESRLVSGLFFAGEVLDIDGDTGGFNIQAAVSTGFLAGLKAGSSQAQQAGATGV